jgi:hypothetical protein
MVYNEYVVKSCQVHHNTSQDWYYLRDQMPSEALVFVQAHFKFGWSRCGKLLPNFGPVYRSYSVD